MTLSITAFSFSTIKIAAFSITIVFNSSQSRDIQHNDTKQNATDATNGFKHNDTQQNATQQNATNYTIGRKHNETQRNATDHLNI
jgi:hypothetical protein